MGGKSNRSAIYLSSSETYHADRCEPLVYAAGQKQVTLSAFARRGYPGRPMPQSMLPEVSTIGFWDAAGAQCWGLDWHRNEGIELTYLARGKSDFRVERQRFSLEAGHLTVTRPWQRHRLGDPHIDPCRLCWIILDVGVRRPNQKWRWPDWFVLSREDLDRLTMLLSHNERPVWPANDEIAACFERIAALVQNPRPASVESRLKVHINELFLTLLELLRKKNVSLDARLVSTQRTVELFLASLPQHLDHLWTLDEMAEQCGLGRSQFSEYSRKILNMSPADYLIRCRVEAAKTLLSERPEMSITDIALACGFQSSQYFATTFRLRTGCAPREYRSAGG